MNKQSINSQIVELTEHPSFKALDLLCEQKVKDALRTRNVGAVEWYDKPATVLVYCFNPQALRYETIPVSADDFRRWHLEITGVECKW